MGIDEKIIFFKILVTATIIVISIFHSSGNNKKEDGLIYILIWTPANYEPFNFIDMGRKAFGNCTFNNCYLTADHSHLNNILDFDVIMFNIWQLGTGDLNELMVLPPNRSEAQIYCMYGVEPAAYHPLSGAWNGFFNITFTYKLSSNITIPYVVVKDEYDKVIGPEFDMQWMNLSEMRETSDYVKNKLFNKHIAAAWIVSNCEPPWRRLYADDLREELARRGHNLHVFGKCGDAVQCPKNERVDECFALIESDYYFYLSFENSFGEDYVTEKLLHALEHYAVPVVFGRANYSRFMPEGIYLDANILRPDKMAETMIQIINDKNRYYDFFKWHEHYSFHSSSEDRYSREICKFCAFLNNNKNETNILNSVAQWWNEEWPPWPEPEKQSKVEAFVSNVLNFLDPSTD